MRKFLRFVVAAGTWGLLSMIAALALFTIAVVEHIRDKNVTSYVLLVFAALVFCFGSFLAWLEEHKKYEMEKNKHDNPNLVLNVESILTSYRQQDNVTTLCFACGLTNLGSPSNAGGWTLRYQSHSIDLTVKFMSLPDDKVPFPVAGGRNLVLKRLELLPARTLSAIERGHTKHGRLLYEIPGDRRDEVHSGAAMMWVGCVDNTGRICQSPFKTGPERSRPDLLTFPDEETQAAPAVTIL